MMVLPVSLPEGEKGCVAMDTREPRIETLRLLRTCSTLPTYTPIVKRPAAIIASFI